MRYILHNIWELITLAVGIIVWVRYRRTRAQRDFDRLAKQCIAGLNTQLGAPDAVHEMYDKQYKKWASVEAVWSSGSIELQLSDAKFDVSVKPSGGKAVLLAERYSDRLKNSIQDPIVLRELCAIAVQVLRGDLVSV